MMIAHSTSDSIFTAKEEDASMQTNDDKEIVNEFDTPSKKLANKVIPLGGTNIQQEFQDKKVKERPPSGKSAKICGTTACLGCIGPKQKSVVLANENNV